MTSAIIVALSAAVILLIVAFVLERRKTRASMQIFIQICNNLDERLETLENALAEDRKAVITRMDFLSNKTREAWAAAANISALVQKIENRLFNKTPGSENLRKPIVLDPYTQKILSEIENKDPDKKPGA